VRGRAGKQKKLLAILDSLTLKKRMAVTVKPNNAAVRGMLDKVKHLVCIETKEAFEARLQGERDRLALRPPIVVTHKIAPTPARTPLQSFAASALNSTP